MRYAVAAVFMVVYILLKHTVTLGKGLRLMSRSPEAVQTHKEYAHRALTLTIMGIIFVEYMVRTSLAGEYPWDYYIFWFVHLPTAVIFFILLLLVISKYNGQKRPIAHSRLVYKLYYSYLVAAVTGLLLLFPEILSSFYILFLFFKVLLS